MSWKEATVMSEKRRFIEEYLQFEKSISELSREFGISRKTAHKWINRYEQYGESGLQDLRQVRTERVCRYTMYTWQMITALHEQFPTWGPKKLKAILERDHPDQSWPSVSRIKAEFKQYGISCGSKRTHTHVNPLKRKPYMEINAPNDTWSIDFKGWVITAEGHKFEPLTLIDCFSRFLFHCLPVNGNKTSHVVPVLENTFFEYGRPKVLRSDNGTPFGSKGLGSLTPLSVWLLKRSIFPEKIVPGAPADNGRLERFHRTLKSDAMKTCGSSYAELEQRLRDYRNIYNTHRPHEALGNVTPCQVYKPSIREYHGEESYDYPNGYTMKKVSTKGLVRHNGVMYYVTESLANEYIGLGKEENCGHPMLFLGYPLGYIEDRYIVS